MVGQFLVSNLHVLVWRQLQEQLNSIGFRTGLSRIRLEEAWLVRTFMKGDQRPHSLGGILPPSSRPRIGAISWTPKRWTLILWRFAGIHWSLNPGASQFSMALKPLVCFLRWMLPRIPSKAFSMLLLLGWLTQHHQSRRLNRLRTASSSKQVEPVVIRFLTKSWFLGRGGMCMWNHGRCFFSTRTFLFKTSCEIQSDLASLPLVVLRWRWQTCTNLLGMVLRLSRHSLSVSLVSLGPLESDKKRSADLSCCPSWITKIFQRHRSEGD